MWRGSAMSPPPFRQFLRGRSDRRIRTSGSEPGGLISQNGTVPWSIGKETELNGFGSRVLLLFRNYFELPEKQRQHSIAMQLKNPVSALNVCALWLVIIQFTIP